MGASEFCNRKSAKTAEEAFQALVDEARHESGNGQYTGTIAEKSDFRFVELHAGESPRECAERFLEDDNHWSGNKRGPAACIDAGPDPKIPGNRRFWFFGMASW